VKRSRVGSKHGNRELSFTANTMRFTAYPLFVSNKGASMEEKDIDANEEVAELAEAILRVSEVGERLLNSRLSKRAIKVLIKDLDPRLSLGDIQAVLEALPRLKAYIK
jgi:hypothetical protein